MSKMPVNKNPLSAWRQVNHSIALEKRRMQSVSHISVFHGQLRLGSRQMDCISILQVRRNRKSLSLSRVIGEDGEKETGYLP